MALKTKYIALIADGIGGAEKRFVDIFSGIQQSNSNIYLVVPKKIQKVISREIPHVRKNVIGIGNELDSFFLFLFKYFKFVWGNRKTECSFHYPINCLFFFHWLMPHFVSASLTDPNNTPALFSFRRTVSKQYLILRFSEKVDVLNPSIYQNILIKFPKYAGKISLTPNGTYVAPKGYTVGRKNRDIILMGRLIPDMKGVEDFLEITEEVSKLLKTAGLLDFKIRIVGEGPLFEEVKSIVDKQASHGVPIELTGYCPAKDVLHQSPIVVSFQKWNNYPSRVVAEALLSGAHVLIRDTGESRNFGDENPGIRYIDGNPNPQEIVDNIIDIFSIIENNSELTQEIRKCAIDRFSNRAVLKYISEITEPY